MTYKRIPTVEEVNAAYMSIPDASAALNGPGAGQQRALASMGLKIVYLCGKPMVYKHAVEELKERLVKA